MTSLYYTGLDPEHGRGEIEEALARARYLRGETFARLVRGAATAVGRLVALVRRWRERAIAYRQLMEKDDHELRDIGLARGEIRDAVYGRWLAKGQVLGGGIRRLGERVAARRQRRLARAELMALDDRLLSDIGITRSEIDAAVTLGALRKSAANENLAPAANDDNPRHAA